jgi:hypothetical protein
MTLYDRLEQRADNEFQIRTPLRPGRWYDAQVWADDGYWVIGRDYPDTAAARDAARAFVASNPQPPGPGEEPPANWVRRRREAEDFAPKWVRRCKGGAWQARPWSGLPWCPSINLGLFTLADNDNDWRLAQWSAGRAAKEFARFFSPTIPGRGLRETFAHLKRKKYVREDLLPPAVKRVPGGFVGRATVRGQVVETGVKADEWAAFEELQKLAAAVPKKAVPPCETARKVAEGVERSERRLKLITLEDYFSRAAGGSARSSVESARANLTNTPRGPDRSAVAFVLA